MARQAHCQLLRPRWLVDIRHTLYRSQSPRRQITTGTGIHSKNGPTQAELLKFALKKDAHLKKPDSSPRKHAAAVFLGDWPRESSPVPLWRSQPPNVDAYFENRENALSRVNDLGDLQAFVEGNVISSSGDTAASKQAQNVLRMALQRCERHNAYGDILSFINGLEERFARLDSKKDPYLHVLGMNYACLALSESALIHHLQRYLKLTDQPLNLEHSNYLVQRLLSSLKSPSLREAKHDTSRFLRHVIGEPSSPTLNQILYWSRADNSPVDIGSYLSLLLHSESNALRQDLWDRYLEHTVSHSDPTQREFQSAYEYSAALIDAGDSGSALTALKQVSDRSGDFPGISKFYRLGCLLGNDGISKALGNILGDEEYAKVLDIHIKDIEQRLGIKWDSDQALHIGLTDGLDISDQPLLTMDGDSPGYDNPERLIGEIQAFGSSKSPDGLGKVADLLDEYEGNLVPVSIPSCTNPDVELCWAPQRSPMELPSGRGSSQNTSLSNLGLIKVTTDKEQTSFAFIPNLYLMQLGFLIARQNPSAVKPQKKVRKNVVIGPEGEVQFRDVNDNGNPKAGPAPRPEPTNQSEDTGYLVTWDRTSGRFLIVFAGKERQTVPPSEGSKLVSGLLDPDAILQIYPLGIGATRPGREVCVPSFRLELDPSPDLILETK